jgi:F-type H+-transporting ATPase subunit delta
MSTRSTARRYASSLFDVARKSGKEELVGRQLAELSQLVAGHTDLRNTLESPAIPISVKKNLVNALLKAAPGLSDEVSRTVQLLAERDRLAMLPDLVRAFSDRLMTERNVVPAEVVTAVPLSADHRAALSAALGKAAGGQITLTERVDPGIVGGVVAKVGSVVFDGSIVRQLERLREKLSANA